jgi:hypothetical protein
MTRERSSLIQILTSETILLDRISKKAWVAAAKHEALYWEFTSEILMEETLARGTTCWQNNHDFATVDSPLLSVALGIEFNQEPGERKVLLIKSMVAYLLLPILSRILPLNSN